MSNSTAPPGPFAAHVTVPALGGMLLACVLVLAQTLLALHDLEHLGHLDQDQCEICITGAPLGAAQAVPELRPMAPAESPVSRPAAIAHPTLRTTFSAHLARAPPMTAVDTAPC